MSIEVVKAWYPYARLYKYRTFDFETATRYHTRILTNRELYFSSPKDFNDPFDFSIPIRFLDGTEEQIRNYLRTIALREEVGKTSGEIDVLVDKRYFELPQDAFGKSMIEREYAKRTTSTWGVHCFSKSNDETLMWAHYAKGHSGFCVGFNSEKLFHYMTNESGIRGYWIEEVQYDDEYPHISPYIESWESDDNLRPIFRVKAKEWEYEKEWRLVWAYEHSRRIVLGSDIIEEIVLGLNCSEENRNAILELVKGTKVEVYQASFIDRSFNVDTRSIQLHPK